MECKTIIGLIILTNIYILGGGIAFYYIEGTDEDISNAYQASLDEITASFLGMYFKNCFLSPKALCLHLHTIIYSN